MPRSLYSSSGSYDLLITGELEKAYQTLVRIINRPVISVLQDETVL